MFLAELTGGNLLFGFLPESIGLLIFGSGLIGFTVLIRLILKQREQKETEQNFE